MSDKRASPLTAAFLWAVWAGAVYSGYDFLMAKDYGQAARDLAVAMLVAAAVAYVERKHKNDSGKAAVIPAELKPGDWMPDSTIYAGISPDTGKAMFTAVTDATLTMNWKAAMEYAAHSDRCRHNDWRVPTKGELNVLFQNRAAIGGFDETGSEPAGWYLSSTDIVNAAWQQDFSDGHQMIFGNSLTSSLRCVR